MPDVELAGQLAGPGPEVLLKLPEDSFSQSGYDNGFWTRKTFEHGPGQHGMSCFPNMNRYYTISIKVIIGTDDDGDCASPPPERLDMQVFGAADVGIPPPRLRLYQRATTWDPFHRGSVQCKPLSPAFVQLLANSSLLSK